MDLSEPSYLRFLDLIYEAAEKPEAWRTVYAELREALGIKSIHVLGVDKRHGTLSYSDGANLPVDGELAYMQYYRHIDPRFPSLMQLPEGKWTHCHELLSEEDVARSPLYQELLLPNDRRYMSACKLADTPEANVIFSTHTSASHGPLSATQMAFVERLMPHLRRACRLSIRNFVYSTQALVGHMLVNKLRQPVILATPEGEVMHTNEAAQQLLRSTRLVRVESGRLVLPTRQHQGFMQRVAEREQELKKGEPELPEASQFQSLRVAAEAGGEALYAFYTVLTPEGAMGTFGLRPVLMLMFYHPQSAPPIDAGLLYAVFGLSPAECRIAALLAEGLSLKQIAQAQGTQHNTVRKQLRSIYQKTDTHRQPELVRLLLHLPQGAMQQ